MGIKNQECSPTGPPSLEGVQVQAMAGSVLLNCYTSYTAVSHNVTSTQLGIQNTQVHGGEQTCQDGMEDISKGVWGDWPL